MFIVPGLVCLLPGLLNFPTALALFQIPAVQNEPTLECKAAPLPGRELLPYGNDLRAKIPANIRSEGADEEVPPDNEWWLSLSRNNTIDCKCGEFQEIPAQEKWLEEGIRNLNQYSWSVSLVSPGSPYAYCGGSLVNDRYVLTAASCVDGSTAAGVEVLISTWPKAHYSSSLDDIDKLNATALIRKKVHRVILHPKYSSSYLDNNIALLRLVGPVPTFAQKGGVSHVCLPKVTEDFDGANSSSLVWRFLQDDEAIVPYKRSEISSRIMSKRECKALGYREAWEKMPDSMMCARAEPVPEDHPYARTYDCPGDAGGPLLVQVNGKKVQVGVDSWTPCSGRPEGVGVYTRITEFIPWINRHIAEDGRLCAH